MNTQKICASRSQISRSYALHRPCMSRWFENVQEIHAWYAPKRAQDCKKKVLENSVTEFLVLELSRVRSPGIFCSGRKKSWNFLKKLFLEFREKMEFLEFSGPRIFLFWNVLSGNFVSRKILAFGKIIKDSLIFQMKATVPKKWHGYKRLSIFMVKLQK